MDLLQHAKKMIDILPADGNSNVRTADQRCFYTSTSIGIGIDVIDGPQLLSIGLNLDGNVTDAQIIDRQALLRRDAKPFQKVSPENIEAFARYVFKLCTELSV